ncbi:MAG: sigma-70 family RNA polymerase sigma factor [Planctomycetota bacterium]
MDPHVTQLLDSVRSGDDSALHELVEAVQGELRRLASRHLAGERRDHTLQPTALVNEAYLKLIDQRNRDWGDRGHFLSVASLAMRRVLLEHARAKRADKRGGGVERVTLFEVESALEDDPETLLALDDLLDAFAKVDPKNARIVELRWFGGLTIPEIASIEGVSPRTVDRGWRLAQAWLKDRLDPSLR